MAMLGGECSPCCESSLWACYKRCPDTFLEELPPASEAIPGRSDFKAFYMAGGVLRADGHVAMIDAQNLRMILYRNGQLSAQSLTNSFNITVGRGGREAVLMDGTDAILAPSRRTQSLHRYLDWVDVNSGGYYRSDLRLPIPNDGAHYFEGAVRISASRLILVPARYSYILKVELPITGVGATHEPYSLGPLHGHSGTFFDPQPAFSGGVMLPGDDVVMLCPYYGATNIGLYYPDTDTYENGPAANRYNWPILLPDGRVLMTPEGKRNLAFYDPSSNSVSMGPELPLRPDGPVCTYMGGVVTKCNQVVLAPKDRFSQFCVYDIASDAIIPGTENNSDEFTFGTPFDSYQGGVAAPDGTAFILPNESAVLAAYTSCNSFLRGFGFTR